MDAIFTHTRTAIIVTADTSSLVLDTKRIIGARVAVQAARKAWATGLDDIRGARDAGTSRVMLNRMEAKLDTLEAARDLARRELEMAPTGSERPHPRGCHSAGGAGAVSAMDPRLVRIQGAYALGVHDELCHLGGASCPSRLPHSWTYVAHTPLATFLAAAAHLEAHPRDAQGARLIFHDGVCASGCQGEQRAHHAHTQTVPAKVLRRVLTADPHIPGGATAEPLPCEADA
jgi:hypothetical protein